MKTTTNPKDLIGLKKAPLRLFPPVALVEGAAVMGLGAKKYGPYNWRENAVRHTVYLEAAMRHLIQAMDGEEVDPESGRPHEAHVLACMAIVLDAKHSGNLIDDRNKSGKVTGVLGSVQQKDEAAAKPVEVPKGWGLPVEDASGSAVAGEVEKTYFGGLPYDPLALIGRNIPEGVGMDGDGKPVQVPPYREIRSEILVCRHCHQKFCSDNPYAGLCGDCFQLDKEARARYIPRTL